MKQETREMKQETRKHGYRNLIVWQKADELAFQVYLMTKSFPKSETFTLVPQIRRAVISVPANIVEGYARSSRKEKRQFYSIARGSLTEVEYYLDFSLRLEYLSEKEYSKLASLRDEVGRLLSGLINSIES